MPSSNNKTWLLLLSSAVVMVILPSFKSVRVLLTMPLYVTDEAACGEVAYVMADGHAYWGRLNGAADLYHMGRVKKILISHEETLSQFNFVKKKNDQLFERAIDYLVWRGVPLDALETIPVNSSTSLSSLSEAQQVSKCKPNLNSIVVVTSAPHTRRSLLCFQRTFAENCRVQIYSDSDPEASRELFEPLWIEYVKLAVYFFAA